MKSYIKALTPLAVVAVLSLLTTSGYAALNVTTYGDQVTWPGGVPVVDTSNNNTPQATFTVNAGALFDLNTNAVAQIFTTGASGFQLDKAQIYVAGAPVSGLSVHLYQLESIDWTTRGYYNPTYDANDNYVDLFNPTKSSTVLANDLTFTFYGTGTQTYLQFDFTGAQEVTLLPNTSYAFEIWGPDPGVVNGMFWRRGGDPYVNGNVYRGGGGAGYGSGPETVSRTDVAGGHRDAGLALYMVPEPSTFALMGLSALLGAYIVRRRRA